MTPRGTVNNAVITPEDRRKQQADPVPVCCSDNSGRTWATEQQPPSVFCRPSAPRKHEKRLGKGAERAPGWAQSRLSSRTRRRNPAKA